MKIETLCDLVFKTIPHFNKPDCLMAKREGRYTNISAHDLVTTVERLAAYLVALGVKPGDRVGLLSENRPEWAYADLAIICAGAITVPIYSTLPAKQIEYILADSEMEIAFVSTEVQLKKILDSRTAAPKVRHMIVFDSQSESPLQNVTNFSGALQSGTHSLSQNPAMVRDRSSAVKADDVFSIIYTSGTTGEPKGVMLTHRNVISNIQAINEFFVFSPDDRALSFLPLSHILERMAGYYTMLYYGCTITYAESVEALSRNLGEAKPTILISVPRVYEKFYAAIMDKIAGQHGLQKKIAVWALKVAEEYSAAKLGSKNPSAALSLKHAIADKLVFKKIRGRLGGRLRILISGGAALPRQLGQFFYGLGLVIVEGYGLTETSPVIAANRPEEFKYGTVGKPIPGVEVKIAEDGEILTRGPHIMKGYYKKPKETSDVISPDGWLRTGDIGEIDADGFLRITDRKKDLIVTSGGKNIAPQFVENTLKTSPYVAQIVVLGDKRKFPCALVVPNMENLKKFAASKQIPQEEMLSNKDILAEVQRDLDERSKDLAPFERVKKIALLPNEFTIESGELTPSLKIKRNVVERKYRDLIDQLYSEPVLT